MPAYGQTIRNLIGLWRRRSTKNNIRAREYYMKKN